MYKGIQNKWIGPNDITFTNYSLIWKAKAIKLSCLFSLFFFEIHSYLYVEDSRMSSCVAFSGALSIALKIIGKANWRLHAFQASAILIKIEKEATLIDKLSLF